MLQPKTQVFNLQCFVTPEQKNTGIYSVLTQCMHKTTVNSDEFQHFHIPIPNAKIAKTLGNATFPLNDFWQQMPILAFFSPILVRWVSIFPKFVFLFPRRWRTSSLKCAKKPLYPPIQRERGIRNWVNSSRIRPQAIQNDSEKNRRTSPLEYMKYCIQQPEQVANVISEMRKKPLYPAPPKEDFETGKEQQDSCRGHAKQQLEKLQNVTFVINVKNCIQQPEQVAHVISEIKKGCIQRAREQNKTAARTTAERHLCIQQPEPVAHVISEIKKGLYPACPRAKQNSSQNNCRTSSLYPAARTSGNVTL